MKNIPKRPMSGYPLWFSWTILTYIGITVGFVLTRFLGDSIGYPYEPELYFLGALVFVGLFIGSGQWLILRTELKNSLFWIPATVVGFIIGFVIYLLIYGFVPIDRSVTKWIDPIIMGTMLGTASGTMQWLVINKRFQHSSKWILISALSWLIGFGVSDLIFDTLFRNIYLAGFYDLVNSFLIGIPVGVMSGVFVKSVILDYVGDMKRDAS